MIISELPKKKFFSDKLLNIPKIVLETLSIPLYRHLKYFFRTYFGKNFVCVTI